jgi:hypothetical protein
MPPESDPFAIARSRSTLSSGRDPADAMGGEAGAVLLTRAGSLLEQLEKDPALLEELALQGFGSHAIESGAALLAAAETQLATCAEACQAHAAVRAEREALWVAAREEYLEFRETVRTEFTTSSARRCLRVTGTIHREFAEFVAQAAASYRAAAAVTTARQLAGRSLDRERIAGAREVLDQLIELDRLVTTLEARRRRAVDERELAVRMLGLWIGELLKALRLAFGCTRHPPADAFGAARRLPPGLRQRRLRGGVRKTLPPAPGA